MTAFGFVGCILFISHLARWLRTRRFSEPTFRPCGATKHSKNTVIRDFSDSFSSLIFFLHTFSSLILPTSAFSSVHFVGSFTSQLSSIIIYIYIYICMYMYIYVFEVSLEVKLPTIWTDEKQSRAEAERRERLEERRVEEKESEERRCRCAKR